MQVRELPPRVDIAHESDVEDVAQVAEGLARADLAARVGWEYEGLREEEHLEGGRRISHLDGASDRPSSCGGKLRTPLLVSGHDAPHTAARHVPASSYFAASRTNRTSYLRNRPPTSWGRMGTVSTPTARPRGVSGAFA